MTRSWAAHIRFFKRAKGAIAAMIMLAAIVPVHAQSLPDAKPYVLDSEFQDMLKTHQKGLDGQADSQKFDWLIPDDDRVSGDSRDIVEGISSQALSKAGLEADDDRLTHNVLVFVSYAMPDAELRDVLSIASEDEGIALVMRGVPDGMRVEEGIMAMQKMAVEYDPVPTVLLDPTLFKRYDIDQVPSIVMLDADQARDNAQTIINRIPDDPDQARAMLEREQSRPSQPDENRDAYVAKVAGISDPTWLQKQIDGGRRGDLGRQGPVLEIAEQDLIEVMKERVAQIDWDQKRESAIENFWSGQKFVHLKQASKARTRRINAEVVAQADIRTSTGEFVARAGDRVNPLDTRPFTQAIVVFDATSKHQLHTVEQHLDEITSRPGVANVMFITTELDKDEGWEGYKAVTDRLDAPLYLVTPDIRERFVLEFVPAVITADSTHFIVDELKVMYDGSTGKTDTQYKRSKP